MPDLGPFSVLLGVNSGYAQPMTGQVTEVTCPVIGQAQPKLTPTENGPSTNANLVINIPASILEIIS